MLGSGGGGRWGGQWGVHGLFWGYGEGGHSHALLEYKSAIF